MFLKRIKHNSYIILFLIFLLGFIFRIYGLDWDNGHHLHPDERFLTMVTSDIKLPHNIFEYFNTNTSPLNPFNYKSYQFFVYGTFPLFLVKYISSIFNADTYNSVYLYGRVISALFDSTNIIILYLLSVNLIKNKKYHLLASFIYAFAVLPIQLSHFFAVDTFLNTFLLTTFLFLVLWCQQKKYKYFYLSALVYGLAAATKISSILFLPIILLFCLYFYFKIQKNYKIIFYLLGFAFIVFVIFRIFQPYAFNDFLIPNPKFISSIQQLNEILNNRLAFYPPEVQYLSKTPLLYPLFTLTFWGFGVPFSLALFAALIYFILKLKSTNFFILIAAIWIIFLVVEQGLQFTNPVRYFLPAYPFMTLVIATFFAELTKYKNVLIVLLILHSLYALAFLNIYSRPHSRTQASFWIYQNIPDGSSIANEYWDDPLPLSNPNSTPRNYTNTMLPLYDSDTDVKWINLNKILSQTDYLILSSNRLWGSIPQVPYRYPLATKYYQDLFEGRSEFKEIIEFNSYPGLSLSFFKKCLYLGPTNYPLLSFKNNWFEVDDTCNYPGIYLRDDTSEEAFTVYDHPKVVIFKKNI